MDKFWRKVNIGQPHECWPWMGKPDEQGYGRCHRNGKQRKAHAIALASVVDKPSSKPFALHSCHNPICVNPMHLRWGDAKDNAKDRTQSKRYHDSTGTKKHKLSKDDALEIIRLDNAPNVSHATLARKFGVSRQQVSLIAGGKAWKHLPRPD